MRALELAPYALYSQGFVVQTTLALVAGSFMIHHCANTITAAGVGNGSTLVICMGIITGTRLLTLFLLLFLAALGPAWCTLPCFCITAGLTPGRCVLTQLPHVAWAVAYGSDSGAVQYSSGYTCSMLFNTTLLTPHCWKCGFSTWGRGLCTQLLWWQFTLPHFSCVHVHSPWC